MLSLMLALQVVVDTSTQQYKDYPELRDSVVVWVGEYQKHLGLKDWTIHVKFDWLEDEEGSWSAWTEASPEYFEAWVDFNLKKLEEKNKCTQLDTVRHELFHVKLWELFALFNLLAKTEEDETAAELIRQTDEKNTTMLAAMPIFGGCDGH